MKGLLVGLMLLPALASADYCREGDPGLCTPLSDKKDEISEAVTSGVMAFNQILALRIQRDEARAARDKVKLYRATREMVAQQEEMNDDFNRAIQLTLTSYHIRPEAGDKVARPRDPLGRGQWTEGLQATWNPIFLNEISGRKEGVRVVGSDGSVHFLGGPKDLDKEGGGTYPNGRTVILIETFKEIYQSGNVGQLAYILHHEANHFSQLVGRGWDNYDEGELRAYKASQAAADVFELDAAFRKKVIEAKIREHSANLARKNVLRTNFPSAQEEQNYEMAMEKQERLDKKFDEDFSQLERDVADIERAKQNADVEFLNSLKQVPGVSGKDHSAFLAQQDIHRKQLEDSPEYKNYLIWKKNWEDKMQQEAEEDVRRWNATYEMYDDRRKRWKYLLAVAGLACSDPGALIEQGRQGKVASVSLEGLDLEWRIHMAEVGEEMDLCAAYTLKAVAGSSDLATPGQLLGWARQYKREHPSFIGRILNGVGGFFKALGELPSGEPSGPSGGSSPAREPRESKGGDSGGREVYHSGSAERQLRGLSGGGSWD